MDILNFHGPEFLSFYGTLFVILAVVTYALRWVILAGHGGAGVNASSLSAYEAAFLNGGARLAISTAVTSLAKRGVIAVDKKTKVFSIVQEERARLHPIEELVLMELRKEPARIRTLYDNLNAHVECPRLAEGAYVLNEGQRYRRGILSAAPFTLLFVLGVVKIFIGISRGKSVGLLVAASLLIAAVAYGIYRSIPRITRAGKELLCEMQGKNMALMANMKTNPAVVPAADMLMAVGLFGPVILGGPELDIRRSLAPFGFLSQSCAAGPKRQHTSGGSCGSSGNWGGCGSGCSSSSGSCGGGGCGGGGCGGCGS